MKRKRDLLIGASLLALIVSLGGNGRDDAHILKFTRDGTFLAQYRKPGVHQVTPPPQGGGRPGMTGDSHSKKGSDDPFFWC